MAIKLQLYLKRTGMSLEEWVRFHGVTKADQLDDISSTRGLSISDDDVRQISLIIRKIKRVIRPPKNDKPAPEPKFELEPEPKPEPKAKKKQRKPKLKEPDTTPEGE